MKLGCNQCGHLWDADLAEGVAVVQCPVCGGKTSLAVAMRLGQMQQTMRATPASPPSESSPQHPADEATQAPDETKGTLINPAGGVTQTHATKPTPKSNQQNPQANKKSLPEVDAQNQATAAGGTVITGGVTQTGPQSPIKPSKPGPSVTQTASGGTLIEGTSTASGFKQPSPPNNQDTAPGGTVVGGSTGDTTGGGGTMDIGERGTMKQGVGGTAGNISAAGTRASGSPSASTDAPANPTPPPKKKKKSKIHNMDHLVGQTLDGYRVEKVLGAGGMGAVFLAHQISLDRNVALKVLPGRFAKNADFLARFTREALSAAHLNHHNLIQVYDVGSDKDIHYIAMEFVQGANLGDMVKKDGRLQPDGAASLILQAARGLRYAHDHDIIHRDIKPDNLMVNDQGIVKIADMGLAKMRGVADIQPQANTPAGAGGAGHSRGLRGSDSGSGSGSGSTSGSGSDTGRIRSDTNLTQASIAMGTPAYMAPEQGRDAGSVDGRADQYALGITLYYLLAGTTPYHGTTAHELISKHQTEQMPPLETHVKGVPEPLKIIIERMLAKEPDDRYPDMVGVISELEDYLGISSEGAAFTPREHHLQMFDQARTLYYNAKGIKKRKLAINGFFSVLGVITLLALLTGNLQFAGGLLGLMTLAPVANFLIEGYKTPNDLTRRCRSVFFGMPMSGWSKLIGGTIIAVAVLTVLGLLGYWLAFGLLTAGLAFGYQHLIVKPLREEREASVEKTHKLLRELRLRGLSEEALMDFVCRFGGQDWEEYFEEFFGYENMLLMRGKWAKADKENKRRKFAVWREPVVRALEHIEQERRAARERKAIAKVEAKVLKEQGKSEAQAQKEAAVAATRIMASGQLKPKAKMKQAQAGVAVDTEGRPVIMESTKIKKGRTKTAQRSAFGLILSLVRLALGLVLLGVWGIQNDHLPLPDIMGIVELLNGIGAAGSILGALAGGGLVISVVSRQFLMPLVGLVGGGFVLASGLISEANGMLPPELVALLGLIMVVAMVLSVLAGFLRKKGV